NGALLGPIVTNLGLAADLADFRIELLDDLWRRALRRHDTEPYGCLVTGDTGFGNGRHIRKDSRAGLACRAERFHLAGTDELAHGRHRVEHHVDLPANDIGACLR